MLVVEAAGAVQPLARGVPGAGEQLGGLALRQGLDAVLGAARGVAGVAAKPEIPGRDKINFLKSWSTLIMVFTFIKSTQ